MKSPNFSSGLSSKLYKLCLWLIYYWFAFYYVFIKPVIKIKVFKLDWHKCYQDYQEYHRKGLKLFNIKVVVENPHGIPLDRPYVLVGNHRSWFDNAAIPACLPGYYHFLAKSGYFKIFLFGYGLKLYQHIPVYNGSITNEGFHEIYSYLKRNDSLVVFFEGTRGNGRELLPFKPGAFIMAARSGYPVLPVFILGSENILSKKNSLLSVQPGEIKIIIDQPVYFSKRNWKKESQAFEAEYREKWNIYYKHSQG